MSVTMYVLFGQPALESPRKRTRSQFPSNAKYNYLEILFLLRSILPLLLFLIVQVLFLLFLVILLRIVQPVVPLPLVLHGHVVLGLEPPPQFGLLPLVLPDEVPRPLQVPVVEGVGRRALVVRQDAPRVPLKDFFLDIGFDEEPAEEEDGANDAQVVAEGRVASRLGSLDDRLAIANQLAVDQANRPEAKIELGTLASHCFLLLLGTFPIFVVVVVPSLHHGKRSHEVTDRQPFSSPLCPLHDLHPHGQRRRLPLGNVLSTPQPLGLLDELLLVKFGPTGLPNHRRLGRGHVDLIGPCGHPPVKIEDGLDGLPLIVLPVEVVVAHPHRRARGVARRDAGAGPVLLGGLPGPGPQFDRVHPPVGHGREEGRPARDALLPRRHKGDRVVPAGDALGLVRFQDALQLVLQLELMGDGPIRDNGRGSPVVIEELGEECIRLLNQSLHGLFHGRQGVRGLEAHGSVDREVAEGRQAVNLVHVLHLPQLYRRELDPIRRHPSQYERGEVLPRRPVLRPGLLPLLPRLPLLAHTLPQELDEAVVLARPGVGEERACTRRDRSLVERGIRPRRVQEGLGGRVEVGPPWHGDRGGQLVISLLAILPHVGRRPRLGRPRPVHELLGPRDDDTRRLLGQYRDALLRLVHRQVERDAVIVVPLGPGPVQRRVADRHSDGPGRLVLGRNRGRVRVGRHGVLLQRRGTDLRGPTGTQQQVRPHDTGGPVLPRLLRVVDQRIREDAVVVTLPLGQHPPHGLVGRVVVPLEDEVGARPRRPAHGVDLKGAAVALPGGGIALLPSLSVLARPGDGGEVRHLPPLAVQVHGDQGQARHVPDRPEPQSALALVDEVGPQRGQVAGSRHARTGKVRVRSGGGLRRGAVHGHARRATVRHGGSGEGAPSHAASTGRGCEGHGGWIILILFNRCNPSAVIVVTASSTKQRRAEWDE
mmetsp:Transcript_31009/g.92956  ORF Transcript_31009/g.92956 Transcript_31009/m.92956 type:complete len:934 (+) Transcript_31009:1862-4663(+)